MNSSDTNCNRIHTDEQEMMLCKKIQVAFIDKQLPFTDYGPQDPHLSSIV
jgi:hypothetical protein